MQTLGFLWLVMIDESRKYLKLISIGMFSVVDKQVA